ncbi:MAG: MBL fold metallo-hydrolase [Pseudomonadota bacterium]
MSELSRRDVLKLSGSMLGGLTVGSILSGCARDSSADSSSINCTSESSQSNNLLAGLSPYYPGTEPLGADEMRISFMGTTCIPMISQAAVSVFVELGNGDCFAFDLGTGSIIKYWAMGINLDKLDRIFLAHLHADHMGDLSFVYGFGPSYGRLWPLYVWGPSDSNFVYTDPNGKTRGPFKDGTEAYCDALRQMMVWHNESQSFLTTSYQDYSIPPYDPDPSRQRIDAYDLVPIELDWKKTGMDDKGNFTDDNVAYNHNGVKITHFPAVHCRSAALSYKLEWNGLSIIYSGDTLPNQYMIDHARQGVDVLIHEMVMPAENWVAKMGVDPATHPNAVTSAQQVQDSSHTPQVAYGYILDQIRQTGQAPRLAVGTHFQATDDTICLAMENIRKWYPQGAVTIAADTMVLNVTASNITQRRAVISNYAWPQANTSIPYTAPNAPAYWKIDPNTNKPTGDPTGQLDPEQYTKVIDKGLYDV